MASPQHAPIPVGQNTACPSTKLDSALSGSAAAAASSQLEAQEISLTAKLAALARLEPALDPCLDLGAVVRRVVEGACAGMTVEQGDALIAETAVALSSTHIDYETLAARVAISAMHAKTPPRFSDAVVMLAANVHSKTGRPAPLVSDELIAFTAAHRDALDAAICHERDYYYTYFGLMTLQRGYLMCTHEGTVDRPQYMIMRVAIGHYGWPQVDNALERVLTTYDMMSRHLYTSATPTLFNAGTPCPQNSSCFLLQMKADSIEGIYDTLKQCALISKSSGGVGFATHKIRASGSYVAGSNGNSNGIVPMLRVFNDTARYVDQCFTGDALVVTADRGPVPIGVLYREAADAHARLNDKSDPPIESGTTVAQTRDVKVLSDDGRWCSLGGVVRHAPKPRATRLVASGTTLMPRWAMPNPNALRFAHGVRLTGQHQVQVLCDVLDHGRPVVIADAYPAPLSPHVFDHSSSDDEDDGVDDAEDNNAPDATDDNNDNVGNKGSGNDDNNDNVDDKDQQTPGKGGDKEPTLDDRLASLCERINRGYVVPRMVDADDLVPGTVLCVPVPPDPEPGAATAHKVSDWRMAGILYAAISHGATQICAASDSKTAHFIATYLAVSDPDCAASTPSKNGLMRWRISHPGFSAARALSDRACLALAPTPAIESFLRGVYEALDGSTSTTVATSLATTLRWLSLRLTRVAASHSPRADTIASGEAAVLSCGSQPSSLCTAPLADGSARPNVVPWSIVHGNVVHMPIESIDPIDAEGDENGDQTPSVGSRAPGDDGALYDLEVDDDSHTYSVLGLGACHNGGGKRKGAFASYLEPWHADVYDWIDLKKNHGKEEARARDLFYGMWTCDLFMRRVIGGAQWSLFCPAEAPGLDACHGAAFDGLYERYEREGRARATVPARQLWSAILNAQMETGTPYMLHKDAANITSNQQNLGTIVCSNLCCEIIQYSSPEECSTCLTGDALIMTDKGLVRLDACDGANVLVPFKADDDLVAAPRYEHARLIDNGIKPVFRIETKSGVPVEATADHKVLVFAGRDYRTKQDAYRWARVDQIRPGDKIVTGPAAVSPQFDIDRSTDNEHKAHLAAGWCLGDGWCLDATDGSRRIFGACFGPTEKVAQTVVLDQLAAIYNTTEPAPYGSRHLGVPKAYTQPDGVVNWQVSRASFVDLMIERFGFSVGRGPTKRIGAAILRASAEEQAAFLSGLFCADGTVFQTTRTPLVGLSSASRGLLEDAQLMLRCFGITSKINWYTVKSRGTQQGNLDIRDKKSIQAFHRYIGFRLSPQKQEKLETCIDFGYKVVSDSRAHEVVRSITPSGDKRVYDLSVPAGHHFVANGKVVHNCNLSSVALPKFVITDPRGNDRSKPLDPRYDDAGVALGMVFDHMALAEVVEAIVDNINRIIDINYYPVPEARRSNMRHRPMGIGAQGLADVFAIMSLPWDSAGARRLNRAIFETIYHAAVTASARLASVHGPYPSYREGTWRDPAGVERRGSPASCGFLHPDLWAAAINDARRWEGCDAVPLSAEHRRPFDPKAHESGRWDWDVLRASVAQHGLRNSLLVALMPTASTSHILGNTEACEVLTTNIYTRRVLSGDFTVVNRHLARRMMERGLWTPDFRDRLVAARGSVQGFADDEVSPDLKALFKTVWEIPNRVTIDMAADRAPYVDQSQSLNLYCAEPTLERLTSMHAYAWRRGLKTGMYYLRTKPATNAAQVTVDVTAPSAQSVSGVTTRSNVTASDASTANGNTGTNATDADDGAACYPGCESCSG